jgi:RNA polymerase-binding transcription factor DksA
MSLSIKPTTLPKYEPASINNNNKHPQLRRNAILHKSKLIHEHEYTQPRIKEASFFLVQCATCGLSYCKLCGKAL